MGDYVQPVRLEEALDALARPHTVLAGGTDFYPARVGRPVNEDILDISRIKALQGISRDAGGGWRLGATTSWSELLATDLPPVFDGLKSAAREIGGIQIQNRGTIAGNLCNASPAADGVPPLLALDAEVELVSASGRRRMALADFIVGNRKTLRRPDEILTSVIIPRDLDDAASAFLKLGARRYLVISIAMVAAVVKVDNTGRVAEAHVAVGSCSVAAQRLTALEGALAGAPARPGLGAVALAAHLAELSPIDDVRATAT